MQIVSMGEKEELVGEGRGAHACEYISSAPA